MEAADCWQQSPQAIAEPHEVHDDDSVEIVGVVVAVVR